MAVRDPAFWRRFSIAVHLDEEAQAQKQAGPDLKHTYVSAFSSYTPSSPNFPTDCKTPTLPSPIYQKRLASRSLLSLNLTGRPPSRIKFWTTVDATHRESWLERQRQKKSRRTLLCWAFWIGFIALVAGVVVTILTLKAKGIIK